MKDLANKEKYTYEDFLDMKEGQNYILLNDLDLENVVAYNNLMEHIANHKNLQGE